MTKLEPTRTSSDLTATERLRRMLDERGVEYVLDDEYAKKYPPEQMVTWSCDLAGEDMTVTARDYFIGDGEYCLDLEFHEVFTTEQAIAATLGREPDDDAMVKLHDHMNAALLEYERALGSEKAEGAITVPFVAEMHRLLEEAATLGSCNCSNSERTDAPRLPHFWTHDGTLHIELPKLPESISVRLPDQRDREVHSARTWQYTRDSGTCHAIVSDNLTESEGMGDAWADCSECGHLLFVLTDPNSEPPNYCSNCGRRIEVDA